MAWSFWVLRSAFSAPALLPPLPKSVSALATSFFFTVLELELSSRRLPRDVELP